MIEPSGMFQQAYLKIRKVVEGLGRVLRVGTWTSREEAPAVHAFGMSRENYKRIYRSLQKAFKNRKTPITADELDEIEQMMGMVVRSSDIDDLREHMKLVKSRHVGRCISKRRLRAFLQYVLLRKTSRAPFGRRIRQQQPLEKEAEPTAAAVASPQEPIAEVAAASHSEPIAEVAASSPQEIEEAAPAVTFPQGPGEEQTGAITPWEEMGEADAIEKFAALLDLFRRDILDANGNVVATIYYDEHGRVVDVKKLYEEALESGNFPRPSYLNNNRQISETRLRIIHMMQRQGFLDQYGNVIPRRVEDFQPSIFTNPELFEEARRRGVPLHPEIVRVNEEFENAGYFRMSTYERDQYLREQERLRIERELQEQIDQLERRTRRHLRRIREFRDFLGSRKKQEEERMKEGKAKLLAKLQALKEKIESLPVEIQQEGFYYVDSSAEGQTQVQPQVPQTQVPQEAPPQVQPEAAQPQVQPEQETEHQRVREEPEAKRVAVEEEEDEDVPTLVPKKKEEEAAAEPESQAQQQAEQEVPVQSAVEAAAAPETTRVSAPAPETALVVSGAGSFPGLQTPGVYGQMAPPSFASSFGPAMGSATVAGNAPSEQQPAYVFGGAQMQMPAQMQSEQAQQPIMTGSSEFSNPAFPAGAESSGPSFPSAMITSAGIFQNAFSNPSTSRRPLRPSSVLNESPFRNPFGGPSSGSAFNNPALGNNSFSNPVLGSSFSVQPAQQEATGFAIEQFGGQYNQGEGQAGTAQEGVNEFAVQAQNQQGNTSMTANNSNIPSDASNQINHSSSYLPSETAEGYFYPQANTTNQNLELQPLNSAFQLSPPQTQLYFYANQPRFDDCQVEYQLRSDECRMESQLHPDDCRMEYRLHSNNQEVVAYNHQEFERLNAQRIAYEQLRAHEMEIYHSREQERREYEREEHNRREQLQREYEREEYDRRMQKQLEREREEQARMENLQLMLREQEINLQNAHSLLLQRQKEQEKAEAEFLREKERMLAEERRNIEERRNTEEQLRLQNEASLLEQKRLQEEAILLHKKRIQEETRVLEEARLLEEYLKQEEAKILEEKKLYEERRKQEAKRIQEENRALEARRKLEEKRILEQKKLQDEEMLLARKNAEEKQRMEKEEALLRKKRLEEKSQAAAKQLLGERRRQKEAKLAANLEADALGDQEERQKTLTQHSQADGDRKPSQIQLQNLNAGPDSTNRFGEAERRKSNLTQSQRAEPNQAQPSGSARSEESKPKAAATSPSAAPPGPEDTISKTLNMIFNAPPPARTWRGRPDSPEGIGFEASGRGSKTPQEGERETPQEGGSGPESRPSPAVSFEEAGLAALEAMTPPDVGDKVRMLLWGNTETSVAPVTPSETPTSKPDPDGAVPSSTGEKSDANGNGEESEHTESGADSECTTEYDETDEETDEELEYATDDGSVRSLDQGDLDDIVNMVDTMNITKKSEKPKKPVEPKDPVSDSSSEDDLKRKEPKSKAQKRKEKIREERQELELLEPSEPRKSGKEERRRSAEESEKKQEEGSYEPKPQSAGVQTASSAASFAPFSNPGPRSPDDFSASASAFALSLNRATTANANGAIASASGAATSCAAVSTNPAAGSSNSRCAPGRQVVEPRTFLSPGIGQEPECQIRSELKPEPKPRFKAKASGPQTDSQESAAPENRESNVTENQDSKKNSDSKESNSSEREEKAEKKGSTQPAAQAPQALPLYSLPFLPNAERVAEVMLSTPPIRLSNPSDPRPPQTAASSDPYLPSMESPAPGRIRHRPGKLTAPNPTVEPDAVEYPGDFAAFSKKEGPELPPSQFPREEVDRKKGLGGPSRSGNTRRRPI